jgi:hypothetical protein
MYLPLGSVSLNSPFWIFSLPLASYSNDVASVVVRYSKARFVLNCWGYFNDTWCEDTFELFLIFAILPIFCGLQTAI